MTKVNAVKRVVFIPFENGVKKIVFDVIDDIGKKPIAKAQEQALLQELTTSSADVFTKANADKASPGLQKVKSKVVQEVIGEVYIPYEGGIRTEEVTRSVLAPRTSVYHQSEDRIIKI